MSPARQDMRTSVQLLSGLHKEHSRWQRHIPGRSDGNPAVHAEDTKTTLRKMPLVLAVSLLAGAALAGPASGHRATTSPTWRVNHRPHVNRVGLSRPESRQIGNHGSRG